MGLLGALFKPFKKLVKKIGKKVKKVFKKIGKAIGKLGIVGQIGMMFLMPYAAGALGSFFGTAGTLSKWGATLLSKPGIGRAVLGHTLNAINTVGTMAGKVYTSVTDTISKSFDTVVNKGREILGVPKAPVSPGTAPSEVAITEGGAIGEGRIAVRQENLSKILGDYNEANRQSLFGTPIGAKAEASLLAPEKAVADEAIKNIIANREGPSLTAPNV